MKRVGILISGRGSNMEALVRAAQEGRLTAEVVVVVSNVPDANGIQRARSLGIEAICIPSRGLPKEDNVRLLVEALRQRRVDVVCLAGYMRLLTPYFVEAFPRAILNIHPSLLPAFPGLEGQRQAVQYGVKVSGCTVHFVDESVDHGPIILQAIVPVKDDDTADTLAERILLEEHNIYPEAVEIVVNGQFEIIGRRVLVKTGRIGK